MSRTRKKQIKNKQKKQSLPWVAAVLGFILLAVAALLIFKQPEEVEPAEVSGKPRLVADKELVDLGDVKLDTNVRVDFTLTNVGDGALVFTEKPYVELRDGC